MTNLPKFKQSMFVLICLIYFKCQKHTAKKRLAFKRRLLAVTMMYNDNVREGQKILKRSSVCPSGHMDSSGVASACKLDTRSQTFTWMTSNKSMCVFVCVRGGGAGVHMCYVCVLAACVICQGILAPADEEIKSESPPVVTSCPSTPGVFLTSLSYWLLVTLICLFCVCPTVCL